MSILPAELFGIRFIDHVLSTQLDMFVKHRCPRRQNMGKISESYILTPPPTPKGHVMSVNCEEPIDELTVQVWLLYHYPNFRYCTLFLSGRELPADRQTDRQTDEQTDGWTDDPITRCPQRTIQAEGIKNPVYSTKLHQYEHLLPADMLFLSQHTRQAMNLLSTWPNT